MGMTARRTTHALGSLEPSICSICLAMIVACGDSSDQDDGSAAATSIADSQTGPGTDASASTGLSATSAATEMSTTATATSAADTTGDVKFDVGDGDTETGGPVGCECGSQIGFSYVWPSNSNISQVSKINAETMEEEGRYLTSPDGLGSPSRSSVSLSGLSVAVNNRSGGVIKIWSRTEDCDPMQNGMPGLQTSTGAADVLPWGTDDCVHWYIDPHGYTTQRPIGWIPSPIDPETCLYLEEKLWTSGCVSPGMPFIFADRIDGETGMVEDHVEVTGFACDGFGGYGGAVDSAGNFWISSLGTTLARVDHESLEVELHTIPISVYGITVDTSGRPWMSANMGAGNTSAVRFDPVGLTWDLATGPIASAQTGIQEDGQGRMWMNYWNYDGGPNTGATYIDVDTMAVGPPKDLPTFGKGISIDLGGNVWTIGTFTNNAARYDPETDQVDLYTNLDYPYTYSDMTGWALQNTSCNPAG
jgi:hypothetical protein